MYSESLWFDVGCTLKCTVCSFSHHVTNKKIFFTSFYFIGMSVLPPTHTYTHTIYIHIYIYIWYIYFLYHVYTVSVEAKRKNWIPWTWSYKGLWTILCVLGTELRSPAGAGSNFNHWAIFQILRGCFWRSFVKVVDYAWCWKRCYCRRPGRGHSKRFLIKILIYIFKWNHTISNITLWSLLNIWH